MRLSDMLVALGACYFSATIGCFIAMWYRKERLSAISYLGFLTVSGFLAYIFAFVVHAILAKSLVYEAAICGLLYPFISIGFWLRIDIYKD